MKEACEVKLREPTISELQLMGDSDDRGGSQKRPVVPKRLSVVPAS